MTAININNFRAGFRNRHRDQSFSSLDGMYAEVHQRRMSSRAIDIDINRTRVEVIDVEGDEGTYQDIVINSSIDPVRPTHWAFGQMAQRVGAPANYLRDLPAQLVRDNLNHGLAKLAGDDLGAKFMTVDTGDEHGRLQAVTSPTYGRIWDAEVVDAVRRIMDHTSGQFTPVGSGGLFASDRNVFMFMADMTRRIDIHGRAQLHRGFIVYNSEVGSKAFGLSTFLFNSVCSNGLIMGMKDMERLMIRHTSGGPSRFDTEAIGRLQQFVTASDQPLIEHVQAASSSQLPAHETKDGAPVEYWRTIHNWLTKRGHRFTKMEIKDAVRFATAEEGKCETVWDLVQGITASARLLEWADARADLQARAGKVMDQVKM
jgi:hypothetical protein